MIKTRITRGFFSPTNRPPKNIDELWDDVDYYPEEYLNRLAHDGNNGIWIYTHFCDLIPSKIIPEYGQNSARRIKKLKRVVKKCARYGIKVYIFAVEPNQLTGELQEKYPELCGEKIWDGSHTFCTHSEKGEQYCIEATQWLFTEVPELGGYIDITAGERITNCAQGDYTKCPICSQYTKGEIVAHTADLIREGMRRAGAKGEFISWTYEHRKWDFEDIRDYVKHLPDDVMLMQNFDDYGFEEQLGKNGLLWIIGFHMQDRRLCLRKPQGVQMKIISICMQKCRFAVPTSLRLYLIFPYPGLFLKNMQVRIKIGLRGFYSAGILKIIRRL